MVRRPRYPPKFVQREGDKHPDRYHEYGRRGRHQQHRYDDLDRLRPIEALQLLADLQRELKGQ